MEIDASLGSIMSRKSRGTRKVFYVPGVYIMYLYMVLGLNDFDADKTITKAIGRGGP
jgi:hypothetical protein